MMATICIGAQEMSPVVMPRIISSRKRSSVQDLMRRLSQWSLDFPENVVVIMDGLKEPSIDLMEWVIQNFGLDSIDVSCSNITLLGTMPWLTIPSYCKTASDNWMADIQDLSTENKEWRRDLKYQKGQPLIELYRKYGVTPNVESLMGYPTKLLVGERITSLNANLVVIDRHHDRKNFEYYGDKVPCNIIAMNDHGEFDIIKEQPGIGIDNHDCRKLRETVAAPTPKTSANSDNWKNYLKLKISSGKLAKERKTFSGK